MVVDYQPLLGSSSLEHAHDLRVLGRIAARQVNSEDRTAHPLLLLLLGGGLPALLECEIAQVLLLMLLLQCLLLLLKAPEQPARLLSERQRRLALHVAQPRHRSRLEQELHDRQVPMEGSVAERRVATATGEQLGVAPVERATALGASHHDDTARNAVEVEVPVDIGLGEARPHPCHVALLTRVEQLLVCTADCGQRGRYTRYRRY